MKKAPTGYPPADVYDAVEGLRTGEPRPIGWYLEDAAAVLTKISDCLDPRDPDQRRTTLQFDPPHAEPDHAEIPQDDLDEWTGSRAQIEAAINARAAKLLGWYLRDLGDFLSRLTFAFNPPEYSKDWQLQFIRKGRGRRFDPMQQMLRDSDSSRMLRMATRKAGKQEAAIADLKERPGASRANLFKRKRRAQRREHESR
jgi:hypothetical protein